MSRILAKVTRGRIRTGTTKKILVLAVAGILYFASGTTPIVPVPPTIVQQLGGRAGRELDGDLLKRLQQEDEDILLIINAFLHVSS